ncbi:MAG: hypothetical protein KBT03_09235 [Bacteroidales bacterium]|nr:hypothetical protein [Candidatus Scybalousia scybalohippi]
MMNDVWKRIFEDYIKSYESIEHLSKQGIAGDDDIAILRNNLLTDIIETMRSEVEE